MEELVQSSPASSMNNKKTPVKNPQTSPGSRCTRSKAAPDWTVEDTLTLVGVITAVDEDWLKVLSSYQKWKMISDNCTALDVNRSLSQCKMRWESLLADYKKIRVWESQAGVGSYWCLDGKMRKQCDLPVLFEPEVFSSIDAVLKSWEVRSGSADTPDSDSEVRVNATDVEMIDLGFDLDLEKKTDSKPGKEATCAREMIQKLQESAEQVHAILRGELVDNTDKGQIQEDLAGPNASETEFARRQADGLIRAFSDIVAALGQYTEMVKSSTGEKN